MLRARSLGSLALTCVAAIVGAALAAAAVDTCVECHKEQSDKTLSRQVDQMAGDAHASAGLSCASCHGGDATTWMDDPYESMDPKKGYVGTPATSQVAAVCGRCHSDAAAMRAFSPTLPTDQAAKHALSPHGETAARGIPGAATCTSCHRAHGVLSARDPRSPVHAKRVPQTCGRCHANAEAMTAVHLPSDQLREYEQSVHGRAARSRADRAAPVCHDCHGNHATATPPWSAVVNVCGRCHKSEREAFARGVHARVPQFRGCAECHSNHRVMEATDALLAPAGICHKCHDKPGPGQDRANVLHAAYTGLAGLIARVEDESAPPRQLGAPAALVAAVDEELRLAREKLTDARRLQHADDLKAVEESLALGRKAVGRAREALDAVRAEERSRRRGALVFAGLALALALTLAARARIAWREASERDQVSPGGES